MARGNVVRLPMASTPAGDFESAVQSFLSYSKSKNLSARTIGYYGERLAVLQQWAEDPERSLTPQDFTAEQVRAFVRHETDRVSEAMGKHAFVAARAFFNYLHREGFLDQNPMDRVEKPKTKQKVISTFSLEQIETLLSSCDPKTFLGCRDRAIVVVLLDCGLRASELCGLEVGDVDWTEQTLLVRQAKGGKSRVVPFGENCRRVLSLWIGRRGNSDSQALFITQYGDGFDKWRLYDIIRTRCDQAKISGVRCSPHTLRHSMAVSYLRNGGDCFSLQKLLGHSSLDMTRKYAELSQTDVQEKHRLFSPADRLQSAKQKSGRKRLK